jgi:hypothetical protein
MAVGRTPPRCIAESRSPQGLASHRPAAAEPCQMLALSKRKRASLDFPYSRPALRAIPGFQTEPPQDAPHRGAKT